MFVSIEDAIEIVLDLADSAVISEREAMQDSEILGPMREKQLEAIRVLEDHFTNLDR